MRLAGGGGGTVALESMFRYSSVLKRGPADKSGQAILHIHESTYHHIQWHLVNVTRTMISTVVYSPALVISRAPADGHHGAVVSSIA